MVSHKFMSVKLAHQHVTNVQSQPVTARLVSPVRTESSQAMLVFPYQDSMKLQLISQHHVTRIAWHAQDQHFSAQVVPQACIWEVGMFVFCVQRLIRSDVYNVTQHIVLCVIQGIHWQQMDCHALIVHHIINNVKHVILHIVFNAQLDILHNQSINVNYAK